MNSLDNQVVAFSFLIEMLIYFCAIRQIFCCPMDMKII